MLMQQQPPVVEALGAVTVALVDGVHTQEARAAVGIGLAPLADGHLGGPGLGEGGAPALVGLGLTQVVEMAVGQTRQTLEALLAENLELPTHDRSCGRPRHLPQGGIDLCQEPNVRDRVAALEGLGRRPPPSILYPPGVPMLADQPGQLRPRQPRHLGQIGPHRAPVRLAQAVVAELNQRPPYEPISRWAVHQLEVHRLVAAHKRSNLFQALKPFRRQCHDHPPIFPDSQTSGSSLVGFHSLLQAHFSLDKAHV